MEVSLVVQDKDLSRNEIRVLSMPFTILAQQNSELADALAAAEQDAKIDVNQGVWGAVGFLWHNWSYRC